MTSSSKEFPKESRVVRSIVDHLRSKGCYAEKMHGDQSQSAVLDILCCYKGVFVMLEVKRDASIPATPRQNYIIDKIRKSGGIAHKVSSKEEVAEILERIETQIAAFRCQTGESGQGSSISSGEDEGVDRPRDDATDDSQRDEVL